MITAVMVLPPSRHDSRQVAVTPSAALRAVAGAEASDMATPLQRPALLAMHASTHLESGGALPAHVA
jgi:hypothetical protein